MLLNVFIHQYHDVRCEREKRKNSGRGKEHISYSYSYTTRRVMIPLALGVLFPLYPSSLPGPLASEPENTSFVSVSPKAVRGDHWSLDYILTQGQERRRYVITLFITHYPFIHSVCLFFWATSLMN